MKPSGGSKYTVSFVGASRATAYLVVTTLATWVGCLRIFSLPTGFLAASSASTILRKRSASRMLAISSMYTVYGAQRFVQTTDKLHPPSHWDSAILRHSSSLNGVIIAFFPFSTRSSRTWVVSELFTITNVIIHQPKDPSFLFPSCAILSSTRRYLERHVSHFLEWAHEKWFPFLFSWPSLCGWGWKILPSVLSKRDP